MLAETQCSIRNCKHFGGLTTEEEVGQSYMCDAFPDGIPDDIAYGDNLHLEPVEGDHGIRYEQA